MSGRNKGRRKAKKGKKGGGAPSSPANAAPQSAAAKLKAQGNTAFKHQEYEKAVELYTKALESDSPPDPHTIYSNRSACQLKRREYSKAEEDALKCIELQSEWPKGYLRLGQARELKLKYEEALTAYRRGLELAPDDVVLKKALTTLTSTMSEMTETRKRMTETKNPEKDKFDVMIDWLLKGGSRFPKLHLQYYSEDFRGVHALTKVPNDEVILYVPLTHVMTSDVAKKSEIGRKIIDARVDLRSKHSYLASYLLQEKHNPNSFWKPYIEILPKDYRNMPIFFDETERAYLKGSFSLNKIEDRIQSLKREYDNICGHVPEFKRFTHEEFVWARLVVITRIFGLVIQGTKTDGLVPMADMLNHKRPRETKWTFSDADNGFIITTLKGMQSGDEIYDSYGRKCNSRFFVNYGFSLDDNEDNEVVLTCEIPMSDPLFSMKARFLHVEDVTSDVQREFQIPMNYKEKKTKECFTFLRYAHAKNSEIMLFNASPLNSEDEFRTSHTLDQKVALDEQEPLSIENETLVLRSLKEAALEVMSGFDQSLEEDEKAIADDVHEMYSNIRNAIIMRRGEKQVLDYYIKLHDRCAELFKMPWKDLKREAAKCYNSLNPTDIYITNVVVPLVKSSR